MISTNTTSPSSFAASQWAAVAPTFPAPTTVIFFRTPMSFYFLSQGRIQTIQQRQFLRDLLVRMLGFERPRVYKCAGESVKKQDLVWGLLATDYADYTDKKTRRQEQQAGAG